MTLPERPGLLHAVPAMNVFALLTLFLMLGPSMLLQSGVSVELPPSRFQLERFEQTLVVTLGRAEDRSQLYFGRDPVTRKELVDRLDRVAANNRASRVVVLLQAGANVPVAWEREIAEMILSRGLNVALAGASEAHSHDSAAEEN